MTRFLSELHDPLVRALGWSCFSPPLLDALTVPGHDDSPALAPQMPLDERRRDWLRALDREPAALHRYLAEHCHSRRLGLVYEALWHFFLNDDADTELVAHNIPVRHGDHTLGEFDILYYCHRRQRHCHLELAVKFYLRTAQPALPDTALSDWLGPDGRDRFDLKLARLQQHQLVLGTTDEGRRALARLGIDTVVPELMLNGWLFYRGNADVAPAAVSPRHQRGMWVDVDDFSRSWRSRHRHWYALQKPEWLSGLAISRPLTDAALASAQQKPVMLIGTDNREDEQLRLFVTPVAWPGPAPGLQGT